MKITGLETVVVAEFSNLVWVRLHTDEGLIGLGETFRNPEAVVAYIHETCAPYLIGRDVKERSAISHALTHEVGNHFSGFPTRSIEVRGNSAIDLALWDLWGQALGQPIHALLGGKIRDRIPVYNTCAGGTYNRLARPERNVLSHSRDQSPPAKIGCNEDLLMQVYEPARLARELFEAEIQAMKIWPFDAAAQRNRGLTISPGELKQALWPLEQIRREVGDEMQIMIEFHGLWRLPAALEIAHALVDFGVYWSEDPIALDNLSDLAEYRRRSGLRVAASENLGTAAWFREVLPSGSVDFATFDMAWVGGLSEGVRVAHLCDAFDRPIAPHDCTGPVTLICNTHLLAHAPNGLMAETVRAYIDGFYKDVMTELPRVQGGFIHTLDGPGLGAALNGDLLARSDAVRRCTGKCGA